VIVAAHVATGALLGAVTGDRAVAAAGGLALHAAGDAVPHEDFESLRFETGLGVVLLAALALRRGFTDPAFVGAVFCAAPDLEHVIPRPGHERPKLFPSHRFENWHRSGGLPAPLQLAASLVIVGALVLRPKER